VFIYISPRDYIYAIKKIIINIIFFEKYY